MLTQVPVLDLVGSGALDLPASPVAAGRTADVYEVDDRTVVKLYHPGYRRADVEHEVRVAQDAHGRAIPTPAPLGIVEHDGRFGIIFERVTGESMLEHLLRRPWSAPQLARSLADLQAAVHERRLPPEIPSVLDRLRTRIEGSDVLAGDLKEGLRGLIDALPDGDRLCHGDFHPANVLLTASGPVVIDWVDATRGHPLADVARTLVILRLGRPQIRVPRLVIAAVRYALVGVYQRRYASRSPVDWAEVRRWLAVVAAARLCEGVPGERERLLTLVRAALRG